MRKSETAMMLLYCIFFSLPGGLAETQPYTCGSFLKSTSGSFSSPDQDGDSLYDANQRCRWTILAEEHKMIQLQVDELDIEEQKDCYSDYLAIYDGTELKGYYCGTTIPPLVRSSSRVVYVTFVSNAAVSGKGFNATYRQINDSDCGHVMSHLAGTFQSAGLYGTHGSYYENDVVCMWMIERFTSDHFLQLLVVEMDIQPSTNCEADYLMIRGNAETPTKYCGTEAPPLYTSGSLYTFIIFQSYHNISGSGFKAVYTNIDKDQISLRDKRLFEITEVEITRVDCNYKSLQDRHEHIKLMRRFHYHDLREMCGGIRTNTTGNILSVDYDGDEKYEIDLKCVWVIAAPYIYAIELTFLNMDIEWHKNCEWDYIRIFDGYDSYPFNGLTGWYCGNNIPGRIISNTNILFIEFISDRDTTFAGFEARYRYINDTVMGMMISSALTNTTEVPVKDTLEPIVNGGIKIFGHKYLPLIFVLFSIVAADI